MSDRSDKVKAGVFVLITAALFATSVALIAGLRMFKDTRTFYVEFAESVTGLEASSTVRYNGVPVGRVADIGFAPNEKQILVTVEVRPDAPIRASTIAKLKPQGITGISYIDLSDDPANQDTTRLPAGSTIQAGKSISVQLEETLSDFKTVVERLSGLLEENRDPVKEAIHKIDGAAANFSTALKKLEGALDSTTSLAADLRKSIDVAVTSANEAIVEVRDLVRSPETQAIPGNVNAFLSEARETAATVRTQVAGVDLEATLSKIQEVVDRMVSLEQEVAGAVRELRLGVSENRGTILRMTSDMREFAQNLKMAMREVRREPSRLFFGQPKAEREGGR